MLLLFFVLFYQKKASQWPLAASYQTRAQILSGRGSPVQTGAYANLLMGNIPPFLWNFPLILYPFFAGKNVEFTFEYPSMEKNLVIND